MDNNIPQWVIDYNNAGHQSSAGRAINILMSELTRLRSEHDKARNQAIDDVIKRLSIMVHYGNIDLSWSFIKEEIEQLKTKP